MTTRTRKKGFSPPVPHPVFEDPAGRRMPRAISLGLLAIFCLFCWSAEFARRVVTYPDPDDRIIESISRDDLTADWGGSEATDIVLQPGADTDCRQNLLGFVEPEQDISAYVPYQDQTALSGLRARCSALRSVYYEGLQILPGNFRLHELDSGSARFPLAEFQSGWKARNRPAAFPVAKIAPGTDPSLIEAAWSAPDFARKLTDDIAALDLEGVDGGLCLDLYGVDGVPVATLVNVMGTLRTALTERGLASCLIAGADAPYWNAPELAAVVDRAVALTFRPTPSPLTPAAPLGWLTTTLQDLSQGPFASHLTLGFGTFSTASRSSSREAETLPFAAAMLRANLAGAEASYSATVGSAFLRFVDRAQQLNTIWLQDAASFHNQARLAPAGSATLLWPIGYEDQSIWSLFAAGNTAPGQILSAPLRYDDHVTVAGTGPFSRYVDSADGGQRAVALAGGVGAVIAETYAPPPRPQRMQFFGDEGDPGRLAITFNGIGDAASTEILLTLLRNAGVTATFFLTAQDALLAESRLTEIQDAGHLIALDTTPRTANSLYASFTADFWNKLTQLTISHRYGIRPLLVRNPASSGSLPSNQAVLSQLRAFQTAGFLPVSVNISAPYGRIDVPTFLARLNEEGFQRNANVLNFDFTSGNERATLLALPAILRVAMSDGYVFEGIPQMAGLTPAALTPPSRVLNAARDTVTLRIMQFGWIGAQNLILLLAIIVALRSPIYLILALFRRASWPDDPSYRPPVTVIVPAFNEEDVIERTVSSILAADYPNLTVAVVDDGSTDRTSEVVAAAFGHDDRVLQIRDENHGKWFAIDEGLYFSETPIVVVVDADTLLAPDALGHIVQPFKDPKVGAVAGTVEVGNRGGVLAAFQALEYMYTQQILRRAYEAFDGVIVVPGAIGAWRAEAVYDAGQVSGDTITEDADLTLAVHRAGYRVAYQENATSYTEVPESVSAFVRQRLRWTFGMFQVSWKHRRSIIERLPVGYISLIDAVLYGLVTSLIYPFMDLILVIVGFQLINAVITDGFSVLTEIPPKGALAFFLLSAIDVANVLATFAFIRRFEWRLLVGAPLMRFGYRQLLYISSLRALWRALVGRQTHWNKLKRLNTAIIRQD